jgi:hypothetical protein
LCCFARLLQIASRYICTRSDRSPAFVSVCHGLIKGGRRFIAADAAIAVLVWTIGE